MVFLCIFCCFHPFLVCVKESTSSVNKLNRMSIVWVSVKWFDIELSWRAIHQNVEILWQLLFFSLAREKVSCDVLHTKWDAALDSLKFRRSWDFQFNFNLIELFDGCDLFSALLVSSNTSDDNNSYSRAFDFSSFFCSLSRSLHLASSSI